MNFLQNDVISQGKKGEDSTYFDSDQGYFTSPKIILQKYQILWDEGSSKFKIEKGRAGDLTENKCQIKTESVIFQEDQRTERPLIVIDSQQGIWLVLLDFKNEKLLHQEKLYLNEGDLSKVHYNSVYLSPSSDIQQPK